MDIKNKILNKYLSEIEEETITLDKIDKFGQEIDLDGLSEMFDLIENGSLGLHALKLYTIVYDQSTIAELSSLKTLNFVDMIFAAMWQQEIEGASSEEIAGATLGFVLFGTDLTKRIRNGYKQLNFDSSEFEKQFKDIVSYYSEKIKEGSLVKTLSQSPDDLIDSEVLSLDSPDLDSIKKLKKRIEFSALAYEYDEVSGTTEGAETLRLAKAMNERELDYVFLPQQVLNIFNEIRTSNAISTADTDYVKANEPAFGLMNKLSTSDSLMSVDSELDELDVIQDNSDEENSVVKNLKNVFSSRDKKRNNGVNIQNLSMGSTREKKSNSLKYTIIMIFVIAVVGVLFAANTKKDEINEDTTIAEKVVENQVKTVKTEKFEIKRSGTNGGN